MAYCDTCPVIEFRDILVAALHRSAARRTIEGPPKTEPAPGCSMPCYEIFEDTKGVLKLYSDFRKTGEIPTENMSVGAESLQMELKKIHRNE